jgi:hypothetical protein
MDSWLEAPILTRLFQRLMEDSNSSNNIPITIDEAANLLKTEEESAWK